LPPEPVIPKKGTPDGVRESGTPPVCKFVSTRGPVVARKKRAHHRRLADAAPRQRT